MTFVVVQHGSWQGVERDILLESQTAAAFLTAARDYCAETKRAMPEIAEPEGGLRTVAETTEMQWAFDYGPHGIHAATATAAQRAQSDAWYLKYNMSRVSTARPSINGTHTTGRFFDVATAAFLTWLLAGNGRRYGITRPLLNDPNHCEFTPGTATAALDVLSLDNSIPKENQMSATVVIQMNGAQLPGDWSRGGPGVLPIGTYPGGYEATTDENVARVWIIDAGQEATGPVHMDRDPYIAQQKFWAQEYQLHRADAIARIKEALGAGAAGSIDLKPVLDAIAALDTQDDTYQAKLEALLKQSFTGTVTITPKA